MKLTLTTKDNKFKFYNSYFCSDVTPASIVQADQIRSILKEIFDIRQSKLRKSIEMFFKVRKYYLVNIYFQNSN